MRLSSVMQLTAVGMGLLEAEMGAALLE